MNLNDSPSIGTARDHLEDSLCSLAPDAAPIPLLIAGGPHGLQHVGLHPLNDPDFEATTATVIPAFSVLNEAVELALGAFVSDPEICGVESALIAYWGPPGRTLFISAVTRRKTQPPVLGGWLKAPVSASLGPINDGIRQGLDMAHRLWNSDADGLRERIDLIRLTAATEDTDVLPLTVDALREWGWLD